MQNRQAKLPDDVDVCLCGHVGTYHKWGNLYEARLSYTVGRCRHAECSCQGFRSELKPRIVSECGGWFLILPGQRPVWFFTHHRALSVLETAYETGAVAGFQREVMEKRREGR